MGDNRQGSDYDGRCLPGTRTQSCSSGTGEVLNFEQGSDLIAGLRVLQEESQRPGKQQGGWCSQGPLGQGTGGRGGLLFIHSLYQGPSA